MKRIIFFCFSAFLITACSKEDSKDELESSFYILGTWKAIEDYNDEDVYPYGHEVTMTFDENGHVTDINTYPDNPSKYTYDYSYSPKTNTIIIVGVVFDFEIVDKNHMIISQTQVEVHNPENYEGTLYQRVK